jgi:hypothetical protein
MTRYRCGCLIESPTRDDRCEGHRYAACHLLDDRTVKPCPPCQRERWLSISLSPSATPTRGGKL